MALGKTARKIVVVAALAVAALLVVAYFARNAVAASILRSTGSRLLGTRLDVDSVDIDLFGLAVGLNGLRVDNPEGWGTPRALEARSIRVALSGDSRLDRLVVDSIDLDGVGIWFIRDGMKSNISAIVDNLPDQPKAGDAKAPAPEGAGEPMDLLIRRLTLTTVAVHYADRGAFTGEVPVVASLKKVEVREINAKTAGKDISEQLVGQVFESVVLAIAKESAGKLPDMLGKGLQQSVEAGGRLGNQAIDAIGGAAKGAGDAVGGFLKGIGDAIGGKKQ
jgi:hypothetical protein